MGHLINPIAFRLGINRSWENTWFIKNIYYPEFLHNALNLRNFAYRVFTTKNMINSGIFISEIKFFKSFKTYIINIYLYHLELEKTSYKLINSIYTKYYKKVYVKGIKYNLPANFWYFHNADLYAFVFLFSHIFFKSTYKYKKKKKISKFNVEIDDNIEFLINKFNDILLEKVKGKNNISNYIDLFIKNLVNRAQKKAFVFEWLLFKKKMYELKMVFKKTFRYNYYKHNLIVSKLKNLFLYTNKLKELKKKYKISGKIFFNLIYYYLMNKLQAFKILKNKIKKRKIDKNKNIEYFLIKSLKKLNNKKIYKGTSWYKKDFIKDLEHEEALEYPNNNIIDNFFLNIFTYFGKKVRFAKFKNYKNFGLKWGYLIKFLKFLNSLEYKSWFRTNIFFLYLSSCLYSNLKAKKNLRRLYVRNLIYKFIYIWLGQKFFFPIFKSFTNLLRPIFIDLINLPKIKIHYYFISLNQVSARFIAVYIHLKLRKNHYLKSIINPVKKELWRLSRLGTKKILKFEIIQKIIIKKIKKNFIKFLQVLFLNFNRFFFKKIQKNNIIITFDFFFFKFNFLKKSLKKKKSKVIIINKWLKINIFFYFFYGKLQNDFNIKFFRLKIKKKMNWKNKKKIFTLIFLRFNYINLSNIKKFKLINIDFLLIFSNIIKYYVDFNFFRNLWYLVNKFNKRNLRYNSKEYKKSSLIAYKMAFKGRFSRKQRASSIWYSEGRASLNRLNLEVDYAFVKTPLKNSIVSIKIWLFKNYSFQNYKYILKF